VGARHRVQPVDEQVLGLIKAAASAPEEARPGMLVQLHRLMEEWEQRARGQQPEWEVAQPLPECDASSVRGSGRHHGLKRVCTLVPQSCCEGGGSDEISTSESGSDA